MTQGVQNVVRRTITVAASQQRSFDVFTTQFGAWWPRDYRIGPAPMKDFIMEPKRGGRWYELDEDGTQCDTGRVLAYEPPHRVIFSWDIDARWQIETDLARTSEVEVRFTAETPERTRVELEHRNIDRHGDGWEGMRDAVGSPGGWQRGLEAFAEELAA